MVATRCVELERHDKLSKTEAEPDILILRSMHQSRILLENYYLPGDLKVSIGAFVERYSHHRYHESLDNLTPADVYFWRDRAIIEIRTKIKKNRHSKNHAWRINAKLLNINHDKPEPPL